MLVRLSFFSLASLVVPLLVLILLFFLLRQNGVAQRVKLVYFKGNVAARPEPSFRSWTNARASADISTDTGPISSIFRANFGRNALTRRINFDLKGS